MGYVLTLVGPDRPGIVEALAAVVTSQGGNWLESRMMRLGGQFAGILRIEAPGDIHNSLLSGLTPLERQGLRFSLLKDDADSPPVAADRRVRLVLVGQDRPGIVRQISSILAQNGVNVEELETECRSAPMGGESLFHARAEMLVPPGCELGKLRAELERIAYDLMVEINLESLGSR